MGLDGYHPVCPLQFPIGIIVCIVSGGWAGGGGQGGESLVAAAHPGYLKTPVNPC